VPDYSRITNELPAANCGKSQKKLRDGQSVLDAAPQFDE
jgi:hypothetical protein